MKTIAGVLIALAVAPATAGARERPTFREAHDAAHYFLDDYASLVDTHLTVGPCRRAGEFSVLCRARIDGRGATHYRILVTGTPRRNFLVTVRVR